MREEGESEDERAAGQETENCKGRGEKGNLRGGGRGEA